VSVSTRPFPISATVQWGDGRGDAHDVRVSGYEGRQDE